MESNHRIYGPCRARDRVGRLECLAQAGEQYVQS